VDTLKVSSVDVTCASLGAAFTVFCKTLCFCITHPDRENPRPRPGIHYGSACSTDVQNNKEDSGIGSAALFFLAFRGPCPDKWRQDVIASKLSFTAFQSTTFQKWSMYVPRSF
jgi:hypothetical protein